MPFYWANPGLRCAIHRNFSFANIYYPVFLLPHENGVLFLVLHFKNRSKWAKEREKWCRKWKWREDMSYSTPTSFTRDWRKEWSNKEWVCVWTNREENAFFPSSSTKWTKTEMLWMTTHWIDEQIDIDKWETINTLYLHGTKGYRSRHVC